MAKARTLVLRTEVDVTGADKLNNLSQKFKKVGAGLTVGVTTPLLLLGGAATKAASDLNESANAINVTFGEAAGKIEAYGKTAAKAAGLSQRAFNELVTPIGAMLQNVGFGADEAADASINLAQRAADMASVFNTDVSEALGAIQAGLRGEADPLERFGVGLNDAAVRAKAVALGLADSAAQVDANGKAQARLALIMEQTNRLAGDFAKTSDESANAARIAAAEAENAAAKLGQKFLPIQRKLIEIATDLLDAWAGLPAPLQDAVVAFSALAAAAGPVLLVLSPILKLLAGFPAAATAVVTVIPKITAALSAMQGASVAALGPFAALGAALVAFAADAGGVKTTFTRLKDINDLAKAKGWEILGDVFAEITGQVARLTPELEQSETAWTNYQDAISGAIHESEQTVKTGVESMANEAGQLPQKMADELLAAQFHLGDAVTELVNFMDQALSPAQEKFNLQGFLASQELAEGLASNNPLIRQKATEMQQAALERLDELEGSFYSSGAGLSRSFAAGLVDPAVINFVKQSAYRVALAARGVFPSSEPKDPNSPLRGVTTGFGFGEVLAKGLLSGKNAVTAALSAIVGGVVMPSVAVGAGTAMASGGAGVVNNFYLQWDGEPPSGRDEAEIVANLRRLLLVAAG